MKSRLTDAEKQFLLGIARSTIVSYVTSGQVEKVVSDSPGLLQQSGCFVTIHQNSQLRGCIGNFISDQPLYLLVQEMAVSAATRDPRFYPMKAHDLRSFDLEISVLSPLTRISDLDDIRVGEHGLYLIKGHNRGVLLPQVAVEYGWDRDEFLRHTCLKAGLPENAWQQECEIYIFSAQIFSEQT